MNKPTEKQQQKIAAILSDLNSNVTPKVKTALDSLQVHGNYTIIEPLFQFIQHHPNTETAALVIEFLSNLKDSESKIMVMDCLARTEFKPIQQIILSTIWNSPLDYSEFIHDFVKLAVENDFMITLECLTVIENLDGPFDEQHIFEAQLSLKNYHEGVYEKTDQKNQLISEIALLIKDFDNNTID